MEDIFETEFTEVIPKTIKRNIFAFISIKEFIWLIIVNGISIAIATTTIWTKNPILLYGVNGGIAGVLALITVVLTMPIHHSDNPNFKTYHQLYYFIKYSFNKKKYDPNSDKVNTNLLNSVSMTNIDSEIPEARDFILLKDSIATDKINNSICFGLSIEGIDFKSQTDIKKMGFIDSLHTMLKSFDCNYQIVKYLKNYDVSKQSEFIEKLKTDNQNRNKEGKITDKQHNYLDSFLNSILKRYNSMGSEKALALFFLANDEVTLLDIKKQLPYVFENLNYKILTPYETVNICKKMIFSWETDFDEGEVKRAIQDKNLKQLLTLNSEVKIHNDHIIINDAYYKFGCISALPQQVSLNWLENLLNLNANFSIRIDRTSANAKRDFINKNKKNIKISYSNTRKDDEFERANLDSQNALLETLMDSLASGNETIHSFGVYLMVQAFNKEDLMNDWNQIQTEAIANEMVLDNLINRQLDGFMKYTLKTNHKTRKFSDSILSAKAIALSFPFTNEKFDHEFGGDYGYMVNTGDRFIMETFHPAGENYVNNHEITFGVAGSGKTMAMFIKIIYSFLEGNYTVVLDPDNELLRFGKNMDADLIDLGSPNQILNPWDMQPPVVQEEVDMDLEEKKSWFLQEHLSKLQTFHTTLFPDFTENIHVLLTKLISNFYQSWKPWVENDYIEILSFNDSPTYTDFINYLNNVDKRIYENQENNFYEIRDRFDSVFLNNGIYENRLNRISTLSIGSNKLTILNLKTLLDSSDKKLKDSLLFLMFSFVNVLVTRNRYENDKNLPNIMKEYNVSQTEAIRYLTRTAIFIDEAHKLWIDNKIPKKQIFDWYKVLRKYSAKVSVFTQNITDFIGAGDDEKQLSQGIFQNSQYVNLMTLNSDKEAQLANELFAYSSAPLTNTDIKFVLNKQLGSCLFMSGSNRRYMVRFEIPEALIKLKLDSEGVL